MSLKDFAEQFSRLVDTYAPRDADPQALARRCKEYYNALQDIPKDVLPNVISKAIKHGRYFPSPAELREHWLGSPYAPPDLKHSNLPQDQEHMERLKRAQSLWARYIAMPQDQKDKLKNHAASTINYNMLVKLIGRPIADNLLRHRIISLLSKHPK